MAVTTGTKNITLGSGALDNGAWHRAIQVANKMVEADLWNGEDHLTLYDAYELHNRLYGFDQTPASALVEGTDYEIEVIPADMSELYAPRFSHARISIPARAIAWVESSSAMDLAARLQRMVRIAAKYRAQIGNLETEVADLEQTSALYLDIINKQAARINALEAQLVAVEQTVQESVPALDHFKPREQSLMLEVLKQAEIYGDVLAASDSIDWCMKELIGLGALERAPENGAAFHCRITQYGQAILRNLVPEFFSATAANLQAKDSRLADEHAQSMIDAS